MTDLRAIVSLGSRDDHLGHLTDHQLSPLFRGLLRARIGIALLMLAIAGLLLAYDPQPWKLALVLGGAVMMVALTIRDRSHLNTQRLPPRQAAELLGSVMVAHATIIALTGGIHSPFVVVLPAVALLAAISVGRVRLVVTLVVAVIMFVWLVAADDFIGPTPRLIPHEVAEVLPQVGGPTFAVTMAALLTLVLSAAVILGLVVRGAVERAIEAAIEARAETLATLRDQNRELWTLSGAIAHELKNPLASVKGLGSLFARRMTAGTKDAERITVMMEEVERMGSIIDEFLNFSRPLTEMTRRATPPQQLVDKALALHRPLAHGYGVTLRAEVSATEPFAGDPRKLMQVLVNLLHNAVEASPSSATVHLVARDEGSELWFEILDEGPGIDEQIRDRLFAPGTTTKPTGSGIGLTVARAIAQQHGGTLELLDRPKGGCRAVLRLPRVPPKRSTGSAR